MELLLLENGGATVKWWNGFKRVFLKVKWDYKTPINHILPAIIRADRDTASQRPLSFMNRIQTFRRCCRVFQEPFTLWNTAWIFLRAEGVLCRVDLVDLCHAQTLVCKFRRGACAKGFEGSFSEMPRHFKSVFNRFFVFSDKMPYPMLARSCRGQISGCVAFGFRFL